MTGTLDQSELATAFSQDHEFLAAFITSAEVQRRWRCSRRYLRDLERAMTIPRARWILGELRYRRADIQAAEARMLEGAAS